MAMALPMMVVVAVTVKQYKKKYRNDVIIIRQGVLRVFIVLAWRHGPTKKQKSSRFGHLVCIKYSKPSATLRGIDTYFEKSYDELKA